MSCACSSFPPWSLPLTSHPDYPDFPEVCFTMTHTGARTCSEFRMGSVTPVFFPCGALLGPTWCVPLPLWLSSLPSHSLLHRAQIVHSSGVCEWACCCASAVDASHWLFLPPRTILLRYLHAKRPHCLRVSCLCVLLSPVFVTPHESPELCLIDSYLIFCRMAQRGYVEISFSCVTFAWKNELNMILAYNV